MGLFRTIRELVTNRLTTTIPTSFAGYRTDSEPQSVGEDYKRPPILTDYMRRGMDGTKLAAFLKETTSANYRFQFDAPMNKSAPYMPPYEDPLKEWNATTREYILTQTHAAYQRNPLANAAVEYTADFVIGDGFNLTCKNSDVQDVLEDFICNPDNRLREWERQAVVDLQVDGEIILRFFTEMEKPDDSDDASEPPEPMISCIPQRPWELKWIRTAPGNYRRPEMYHFEHLTTQGDDPTATTSIDPIDVPAKEILHVAINHHAYELRGRPDLYRILPWLRADTEFLENRARQNYWRGALLWLVRVTGATAAQVAAVAARWARPPTAGSVAVESANVEVEPLVNPSGAADASEDGRQIKLRNIIGMRMAEYMFADGHNANLASATAQQLPALTRFQAYQTIMIEQVWYPLFRMAIQAAIDAGVLPEEVEEQTSDGETVMCDTPMPEMPPSPIDPNTGMPMPLAMQPDKLMPPSELDPVTGTPLNQMPKMIDALEAFDVVYNPINQHDIKALADSLNISVTNEWVSNETASIQMGFDYAIEQKKIQRERVKNHTNIAQGLVPPPPEMIPPSDPMQNTPN